MKKAYGEKIEIIYTGEIFFEHFFFAKLLLIQIVRLYFTDTDSFVYEIQTECFYDDMKAILDKFDTSDYPEDNVFGIPRVNKKKPGLFKDELNSDIITSFVGLRSKTYSIKAGKISKTYYHNGGYFLNKATGYEKIKRAKGVKKYVLQSQISFDDYLDCIKNHCIIARNQNSIRSKLHRVYTITQKKIALSGFDNKRVVLENNIDTLPWGHYQVS